MMINSLSHRRIVVQEKRPPHAVMRRSRWNQLLVAPKKRNWHIASNKVEVNSVIGHTLVYRVRKQILSRVTSILENDSQSDPIKEVSCMHGIAIVIAKMLSIYWEVPNETTRTARHLDQEERSNNDHSEKGVWEVCFSGNHLILSNWFVCFSMILDDHDEGSSSLKSGVKKSTKVERMANSD